jgi:riboflavin biosynthesis pyrimidine reductase
MRVLVNNESAVDGPAVSDDELRAVYRAPTVAGGWLRVNFVSTIDGAATGDSGKSGSINNAADKRVFDTLRELADVVIVGAGTARIEGYRPTHRPTVVVSRRGVVPAPLLTGPPGSVLLVTCASAVGLDRFREALGPDNVLVLGEASVDLAAMKSALVARGWRHLLSEGGPHLFHAMLSAGVADELCATFVPRMVGGEHIRITAGPPLDVPLDLRVLLEQDGSLLGRWFTGR